MKKTLYVLLAIILSSPLLWSQDGSDKNMRKEDNANRAYEATRALIASGQYEFFADRLISSIGYTNSIVTTPNNIRIRGESAEIYLPYFGEVRANSPYQVDGGIKYEGAIEDYSVEYKDNKRRVIVKFSIDRGIEKHNFIMSINREGYSRVTVISSGRTSISYYGITDAIQDVSDN